MNDLRQKYNANTVKLTQLIIVLAVVISLIFCGCVKRELSPSPTSLVSLLEFAPQAIKAVILLIGVATTTPPEQIMIDSLPPVKGCPRLLIGPTVKEFCNVDYTEFHEIVRSEPLKRAKLRCEYRGISTGKIFCSHRRFFDIFVGYDPKHQKVLERIPRHQLVELDVAILHGGKIARGYLLGLKLASYY